MEANQSRIDIIRKFQKARCFSVAGFESGTKFELYRLLNYRQQLAKVILESNDLNKDSIEIFEYTNNKIKQLLGL